MDRLRKMSNLKYIAKYLWGSPKLYKIYRSPLPAAQQQQPPTYTPSLIEQLTTATITYIVPLTLIISIYHRKFTYLQVALATYLASHFLRSLSRLTNPQYLQFLRILEKALESPNNTESLEQLRCYDFEFKYFPVLHSVAVDVSDYVGRQCYDTNPLKYYVSWGIAHSFGIRLIYPGLLLGGVLKHVLDDGRDKLLNEKGGVRVKIEAASHHGGVVRVDACVFDKRFDGVATNGDTLVICCEGNAGFYEIGMLGGALSEGYSVLGWNHPGFGGSTGTPYPATELTAALGVMDYAVNVLGFKENQIIVYGWSIGGFPATYLASRFPGIKGLLLDATFDDILPLAIPRMPEFMSSLVISTIRNHVNLKNTENLEAYEGPIRIIRRTEDEIIADPPGVLKNNRGNALLVEIVTRRAGYAKTSDVPRNVMERFVEWVDTPHDRDVAASDCLSGVKLQLKIVAGESEQIAVGKLVDMASSILRDYKSTHCTPLPREYYRIRR